MAFLLLGDFGRQASISHNAKHHWAGMRFANLNHPAFPKLENAALRREAWWLSQRPLGVVVPRGGRFDSSCRLNALRTPCPAGPRGLSYCLFLFRRGETLLQQVERIWERVSDFSETEPLAEAGRACSLVLQNDPSVRAEGIEGKRREPLSLLWSRLLPGKFFSETRRNSCLLGDPWGQSRGLRRPLQRGDARSSRLWWLPREQREFRGLWGVGACLSLGVMMGKHPGEKEENWNYWENGRTFSVPSKEELEKGDPGREHISVWG